MTENKRKYQDYLDTNEELEYETNEAFKTNNDLSLAVLNQMSQKENLQSEVRTKYKNQTVLVCYRNKMMTKNVYRY